MSERRAVLEMWAYVTDQGTAMAEAALCGRHRDDPVGRGRALAAAEAAPEWDGFALREASGNEALRCLVCGRDIYGQEEESR
jgi:hypothetical protein